MNFLLKIVEGANKGAEIALVEGVAVTFGKSDECDIVLADATLPDAPMKIEASAGSVSVDGETLQPFHVKTVGATSFAVGPSGSAWEELVWPKPVREETAAEAPAEEAKPAAEEPAAPEEERKPGGEGKGGGRRRLAVGCLAAALIVLLLLLLAGWLLRRKAPGSLETIRTRLGGKDPAALQAPPAETVADVAARLGLSISGEGASAKLSGNFATRRERLAATAEVYGIMPGANLDVSDDESFRAAAEDALFTVSEGSLKVLAATNRHLAVTGSVSSPFVLKKMLEAVGADLPRLEGMDVSDVKFAAPVQAAETEDGSPFSEPVEKKPRPVRTVAAAAEAKAPETPRLPVCGILTTPYPCLVMRSGARIMEGASIGDSVVLKIEADSVTVTNSTGRFVWKP